MINTATSSGDNESCKLHKCTIPYIWWRGGGGRGGGGEGDVGIKLWRTLTHHLSDAETVSEVVKWIVTIILLDCQLWGKAGAESMDSHTLTPSHPHTLTSHRLSVIGLMFSAVTRPSWWYMCSIRHSISLGSQCQMSNVGFLR